MNKGLCNLAKAFAAGALFLSAQVQAQWSLSGNSNATNSSKLGTTNNVPLRLFANNVERMRINAGNGFVGIGTTNPQQRLHVEGASNQAIFVNTSALGSISGSGQIGYTKHLPTGAGNRLGYFLVGSRGGAENNFNTAGMAGYAAGAWSAGSSHPTYLTFETTPSGATSRVERIRIEAGGNVGIGTTNPSNRLHVIGRGRFSDGVSVEESGVYSVHTTGNGVEGYGNSSYGAGLYGSGYYGVIGSGTYGVYANGSSIGVSASGASYGVLGYGSDTYGYGLYGYANSSTATGVYGYGYYGVNGYAPEYGNGVRGECGNGSGVVGMSTNYVGVWGQTSNSSSYAGYFVGNVYSTGSYLGSDSKLKQNVSTFSSAQEIIQKLQPKVYEYKQEGNYKLMNLPAGKHYGFIAQELEAVLPELVKDSKFDVALAKSASDPKSADGKPIAVKSRAEAPESLDFKAVNYTELIPIMVKAMQEQQQQIEDLKDQLNKLTKGQGAGASLSSASMSQNMPNPVSGSTSISYVLPAGTRNARMLVTDGLGRTIKAVPLTESGTLQLNTSTLGSGVYNYSLIIDNQTVSTRKMTVVR